MFLSKYFKKRKIDKANKQLKLLEKSIIERLDNGIHHDYISFNIDLSINEEYINALFKSLQNKGYVIHRASFNGSTYFIGYDDKYIIGEKLNF